MRRPPHWVAGAGARVRWAQLTSSGVAAFGAVFARRLIQSLAAQLPGAHLSVNGAQFNPATVNHLPLLVRHSFFVAITHAVTGVFWLVVPAAAIVFLLAWLIKEVPLRGRAPVAEQPAKKELVS